MGNELQKALSYIATQALKEAGCKDIDYGLFKLGVLEMDSATGGVKDLTSRIAQVKQSNPSYFNELDGYKKVEPRDTTQDMMTAMLSDVQKG
ncbi:hypothetical protein NHG25_08430 [Aerococcaceae bacterium NML191292]|nr:hypothetical protein [Aerococcaceae bacterium NML210727]MCW6655362.1 hypothetical protein [Aerococcaceae bacterium NML201296]MCW6660504.1 hypothetical protein [Aerococcaceae bacterium NML191292]MCW6662256.1 hypothetical protein [Aerococcaceae bacterium NML201209]